MGSPCNLEANVLGCDIKVSEFELQSRYYVHFRANTQRKVWNPLSFSYGLNSITTVDILLNKETETCYMVSSIPI